MKTKIKINFVLPSNLQGDLKEKVINDGYSIKDKSRWVTEAINALLEIQGYPDLVKINDEMRGFERLESITVSKELKKQLDDAIVNVRKVYPEINGVQSRIVRTAIVQRLLRV